MGAGAWGCTSQCSQTHGTPTLVPAVPQLLLLAGERGCGQRCLHLTRPVSRAINILELAHALSPLLY